MSDILGRALARMVGSVGRGAVHAGLRKHYEKPEVQKRLRQRAIEKAEACTPCAAASYVDALEKEFGGHGG